MQRIEVCCTHFKQTRVTHTSVCYQSTLLSEVCTGSTHNTILVQNSIIQCVTNSSDSDHPPATSMLPPQPLASNGQLTGGVHGTLTCRGPLDAPIFEGTVELSPAGPILAGVVGRTEDDHTTEDPPAFRPHSAPLADPPAARRAARAQDARNALRRYREQGAVAAYDKLPIASASGSFSFTTDDCVSCQCSVVSCLPVKPGTATDTAPAVSWLIGHRTYIGPMIGRNLLIPIPTLVGPIPTLVL